MVNEIEINTVPDELYNLTQLAEVTLAAGKLSTTNIHQIKNYIQQNNREPEYYIFPTPVAYIIQDDAKRLTDLDECKSSTANWKTYWTENSQENLFGGSASAQTTPGFHHHHHQTFIDTFQRNSNSIEKSIRTHSVIKYKIDHEEPVIKYSDSEREASCSSFRSTTSFSDEESNSIYSHKIFDRKKCRNFISRNQLKNIASSEGYSKENPEGNGINNLSYGKEGKLIENGNDENNICLECGKKYSTSSNLARHRQTHRSLQDKKARKCEFCDKVYVSMPAYSMHVRTHNQGCKCIHCGKCFSRPWLLQGHIRTHTGEKPFKCSICPKAFADKSNLRAHIQTHSNTKPHSCNRCGKSFALKSYLYKHEESSCLKNHTKSSSKDGSSGNSSCSEGEIQRKDPIRKTKTIKSKNKNIVNDEQELEKKEFDVGQQLILNDDNFFRTSVIRKTVIEKVKSIECV